MYTLRKKGFLFLVTGSNFVKEFKLKTSVLGLYRTVLSVSTEGEVKRSLHGGNDVSVHPAPQQLYIC